MGKYEKRLEKEEWGELYTKEQAEQVINAVATDQVFCWTEELLKVSYESKFVSKCLHETGNMI